MRILFFLFIVFVGIFLSSCNSSAEKELSKSLEGTWLVLYPDHQLSTRSERDVYKKYQDSIVNLFGLKLINLKANGDFFEGDSLFRTPGKWNLGVDSFFQIREGGKGLNPFKAKVQGLENDTLRLLQYLPLDAEKIKVVWHLKKVDGDTLAERLVSPEFNLWRQKPKGPETEQSIRKRLVSLLRYYSDYLQLVSKESSYFLVPRVHLPFQYYQHAIGVKEEMPASFISLFYNEEDARKAHHILKTTVEQLAGDFEWAENFVVEYALFFKRMIYRIEK